MFKVVCPRCGAESSEFNPTCVACHAPLPVSSSPGVATAPDRPGPAGKEGGHDLSGHRIGSLTVGKLLGRGGMSEVYQAWDKDRRMAVAVKLLRPDRGAQQELRKRLWREAKSAAAIDHPAVVKIYEVVELADGEAIIMELVEGRSLAGLFTGDPLETRWAIALGEEIAGGLAAAHDLGLVHRDLKAENVMITADGHAKILDFGLVKRLPGEASDDAKPGTHWTASLTVQGGLVGTVRAMSPEQAQGREVDSRSDLFSLGLLLYQMATGSPPFKPGGLAETIAQLCLHRQNPAGELCPTVPEELSSLIDRLLEKDPARRPQSAEGVAGELRGLLETM